MSAAAVVSAMVGMHVTTPASHPVRSASCLGLLLTVAILAPSQQLTAAVGDAVPRITAEPGTLLAGPLAPEQGRTAVIALHQGWLWTIPERPSSTPIPGKTLDYKVRVWDIRGLRAGAPDGGMVMRRLMEETAHPGNAHGFMQWRDTLLIGDTYKVQNYLQDPASFVNDGSVRPRGPRDVYWTGRAQFTPPWNASLFWTYGNVADPATLTFRANDRRNQDGRIQTQFNVIGDTGVIGFPIILGNLLIYASDQSKTGVATYDISDPRNPVLLDVLNNGEIGGYWPVIWRHYVVWPNRKAGGSFQVVDFQDPTDLKLVANVELPEGNPMYCNFQDEFAFMERYKIDMRTFEIVLTLDEAGTGVETSQYALPVGNLLFTGGVGNAGNQIGQGLGVWVHQREPDTRAPYVGYHIPRDGQTNYPRTHSLSLLIHETLESSTIINKQTAIVRPVGGAAIDGNWWFADTDQLTFVPAQDLAANTTYEVVLPAGGIKDVVGNGIEAYRFTFSTGSDIGGNRPPDITSFSADPARIAPGGSTTLRVTATDPEGQTLQYRFDRGDGSQPTAWRSNANFTTSFPNAGHFKCTVQVRDSAGAVASARIVVTAHAAPQGAKAQTSSPIIVNSAVRRGYTVNPDNNTVTCFHLDTLQLDWERSVAADPRSLTLADGLLWVACHDADRIDLLNPVSGAVTGHITLPYGSAPFGIVAAPAGDKVYCSLYGTGSLVAFDASSRQQSAAVSLAHTARTIAVSADGNRILVTRFISPTESHHEGTITSGTIPGNDFQGMIWDIDATTMTVHRTVTMDHNRGDWGFRTNSATETTFDGRGTPNYIAGLAIDPLTQRAWYAGKKDNHFAGARMGGQLDDDNTVRAMLGGIDLSDGTEVYERNQDDHDPANLRRDIDNSDSPSAIDFSPDGDYMLVAVQGINKVLVYDRLHFDRLEDASGIVTQITTGLAPQGLAVDAQTGRLYVKEFLNRSVGVYDLDNLLQGQGSVPLIRRISTVRNERLSNQVLKGKQIFYNAADKRMSAEGYISCATCHIDGGSDKRVWDFSARGEGFRNTTDLRGRAGMAHGNVHWTANFDEIQDFEHDIRGAFGGVGFLSDDDFAATNQTLGARKAGRNADLDALAAYVSSLGRETYPRSPHRQADGQMTDAAHRGELIFQAQGCADCHGGEHMTDQQMHDIGTIGSLSGQRLGAALTGIDTPTLHGLWAGAPYLHDGSAMTVADVFRLGGGRLYELEDANQSGMALKNSQQWPPISGFLGDGVLEARDQGDRVTVRADGGQGGTAIIDLRYNTSATTNNPTRMGRLRFSANGQQVDAHLRRTDYWNRYGHYTWSWVRVELELPPGQHDLRIEVVKREGIMKLDAVVIRNADQLAKAEPHRKVLNLTANQQSDLEAYLLQLDGREADGSLPQDREAPLAPSGLRVRSFP